MQPGRIQITVLHTLIKKRHFFTLHVILQLCKKLANKAEFLKLLLLTSPHYGTILHFVCRQIMNSTTRIELLDTMFNLFADKHDLIKFVTQKDRKGSKIAIVDLINLDCSRHKIYSKIIWKYLSIMMIAPACYLQFENITIFQIKIFAETFSIKKNVPASEFIKTFNENPKYALHNIVQQYEILKIFKICNFVGKYKQVKIPALNRVKI